MAPIRVVVHGVTGKMGQEVLATLCREADLTPVAGVCRQPRGETLPLPDRSGAIPLFTSVEDSLKFATPDVMVDFTNASACVDAALHAADAGVHSVIGSSGLSDEQLKQLDTAAREKSVGMVAAPNFAIGAVVMMKLAQQAAPFFEYVDIIEMHHEAKIDAPSGTALALAKTLAEGRQFQRNWTEKEHLSGTRGGEMHGIGVHSLRMAGRSAHHEVIFGTSGQTLSIRHDTLSRDCYMPGVVRAIREVVNQKGLVVGLENLLGL